MVFVAGKEDDCLYSPESEVDLREVYLNGFAVVSDQTIDFQQILESILKRFTPLITRVQFLDKNSTRIGTRESMVRTGLAVTGVLWIVVLGLILLRRR